MQLSKFRIPQVIPRHVVEWQVRGHALCGENNPLCSDYGGYPYMQPQGLGSASATETEDRSSEILFYIMTTQPI